MTLKRFTIADYPTDIIDNQSGKKYPCSSYGTHMEIICDLLNELHDENEQLQHDATILIQANQDYRRENEQLKKQNDWLKSIHFANDVLKENKELKQSNERLLKMLDNVANYMQKENKYMPIDDFVEWWNGIATKGLDGEDLE